MNARSLSARSVMASALLGTVPPRLPGRLLVALAEQFGVSEGTARVALSRMVDKSELVNDHGTYSLAGDLLARHERQEEGLRPTIRPWDGAWEIYVVDGGGRRSAARAALRRAFGHLGVYERREGVWLRPDNLDPARVPGARDVVAAQAERFVGRPEHDPCDLARDLFDFDEWGDHAASLAVRMTSMTVALDRDGPDALAPGFELAAEVLRHQLTDPLFPTEIAPAGAAASRLGEEYAAYDARYRDELARFFASVRAGTA